MHVQQTWNFYVALKTQILVLLEFHIRIRRWVILNNFSSLQQYRRKIAQINVFECVSPLDLVYFLWEKSYLVKVCPFSHRSAYQMSYWFQNIYEETFEFEFFNNSLSIFHPIKDYREWISVILVINLIGLNSCIVCDWINW